MKFAKKSDVLIIAAILLVCAAVLLAVRFARGSGAMRAELYHNGTLVETVDLAAASAGRFSLDGAPGVVFALDGSGGIAFAESDCPDQVCVHAGWLRSPGQFAACLPNNLYVKIVSDGGGGKNGPDIVL